VKQWQSALSGVFAHAATISMRNSEDENGRTTEAQRKETGDEELGMQKRGRGKGETDYDELKSESLGQQRRAGSRNPVSTGAVAPFGKIGRCCKSSGGKQKNARLPAESRIVYHGGTGIYRSCV
jgi:hypothetical protein